MKKEKLLLVLVISCLLASWAIAYSQEKAPGSWSQQLMNQESKIGVKKQAPVKKGPPSEDAEVVERAKEVYEKSISPLIKLKKDLTRKDLFKLKAATEEEEGEAKSVFKGEGGEPVFRTPSATEPVPATEFQPTSFGEIELYAAAHEDEGCLFVGGVGEGFMIVATPEVIIEDWVELPCKVRLLYNKLPDVGNPGPSFADLGDYLTLSLIHLRHKLTNLSVAQHSLINMYPLLIHAKYSDTTIYPQNEKMYVKDAILVLDQGAQ